MAAKRRRRKSIPKGVYNVPRELRCGYPLDSGEPCEAARTKEKNGEMSPRCRHHRDSVPDDMPLERLGDLRYFQADILKRLRKGLIDPASASAAAALGRNLQNIMIAMEKLDPEKAATRQVTYEEMVERARNMTVEQARGIAEQRNKILLNDMLTQRIEIVQPSELDEQQKELTPGEKAGYVRNKKAIEKFIDVVENGTAEDVLNLDLSSVKPTRKPAKRKPKTNQPEVNHE